MVLMDLLGKIVGGAVDKFLPSSEDQHQRDELKQELKLALLRESNTITKIAASVVTAEVQGKSALQRNWRPITMLVFVALIVARWMGWTAPGLSEAEALQLWSIVKIGLSGYVIGRSAEKLIPSVAKTLSNGRGTTIINGKD